MKLSEILTEMSRGVNDEGLGLCTNYYLATFDIADIRLWDVLASQFHEVMSLACAGWEHFSGNDAYPVEGGYDAFWAAENKYEGEYGRMRMELLYRMILITLGQEAKNEY